ncbi:MAG: ribonuclease III [Candidatus Harrisonbacteria bacterium]|nr:ribonuclease III [Candidatus Harrisonbacteria bacterium]
MTLEKLEKLLSYEFKNKDLLKEALTHRSYLNENPKWHLPHNERLEFLGDAVLELATTEALFEKFPKEAEGKLTTLRAALVNYQMLAKLSKKIELEKFLMMSRGEAKDTGRAREVILANAMEAIIGSTYLDGGYEAARKFITKVILPEVGTVIKHELYKDPKSLLQERTQAEMKVTPAYKLLAEEGPDHKKVFTVGAYLGEEKIAEGQGPSKQDAEVEAAKKALENI